MKLAVIGALRIGAAIARPLTTIASSGNSPTVVRTSALNGLTGIAEPAGAVDALREGNEQGTEDADRQPVRLDAGRPISSAASSRREKDPDVVRRAIRSLGNLQTDEDGPDAGRSRMAASRTRDAQGGRSSRARRRRTTPKAWSRSRARKSSLDAQDGDRPQAVGDGAEVKVAADYLMEIIK